MTGEQDSGRSDTESVVVSTALSIAGPFALIVGTYLLFAGHNRPGGGFAAGLVFGALTAARAVVGLPRPTAAIELTAFGLAAVALVAATPMVFGRPLLDQVLVAAELPILGKIKSGSALVFDVGVTAIVVGLVTSVLDGLGVGSLAADVRQSPPSAAAEPPATRRRGTS